MVGESILRKICSTQINNAPETTTKLKHNFTFDLVSEAADFVVVMAPTASISLFARDVSRSRTATAAAPSLTNLEANNVNY